MARSDGPNCLICNCEKTMPLEAARLSKALGKDIGQIHNHLCRSQLRHMSRRWPETDRF